MAEIEEHRKTVTKTNETNANSMTECAEVAVVVRSMQQVRINVIGLRDLVNALNAADAPQEAHVDFSLEGSLQQLTVSWTKTETQTKKKPAYRVAGREYGADDHGGRS